MEKEDLLSHRTGIDPQDRVVISAGHTIERKGILDYIALARRMPWVKFIWFGHTPEHLLPRPIRKAVANAPPNLFFAGFVGQEELRDAYCGADVFAFLSYERHIVAAVVAGPPGGGAPGVPCSESVPAAEVSWQWTMAGKAPLLRALWYRHGTGMSCLWRILPTGRELLPRLWSKSGSAGTTASGGRSGRRCRQLN